ncbi:MAG: DUF354 domain-containing protein [Bdellovibrionaceae bacterium]|nr:DUF354 domain-containing protein [Bdellovibrionales bacterium]MCB9253066.1 DUF354 domain-containing protein [Pseudobdellovibrionaceae bacterium]
MKVLIEIGHPAHVHFFSRCIRTLKEKGHQVTVVSRNKEITNQLLEKENIAYRCLSSPRRSKIGLFLELFVRWFHIIEIILKEKIDLAVSISGISTSFPAWFTGIKSYTFTDTEDANLTNIVAFPFSSKIVTPRFFLKGLGKKQVYYDGLHELAYLQDFDRQKAQEIRQALGFTEPYSIIRLVSNDALHDHDTKNLDEEGLRELIQILSRKGKVHISSQSPLKHEFKEYELNIPITQIHAVLEGAQLFVGDSPTMAVESSLLGTPAYLVSPRIHRLGNMVHLDKDYKLLKCYLTWSDFWTDFSKLSDVPGQKKEWATRSERFLKDRPSVSEFVADMILNA